MIPAKRPLIYLITEGRADPSNYPTESERILDLIAHAVESGIPLIQIREKNLPAKLLYTLAREAAYLVRKCGASRLLINDRADIARAAGADGVHLTWRSLGVEVVKRIFPELIVGVSTHTIAEAESAKSGGADFCVFGPVFDSPGKGNPVGIELLREVSAQLCPLPVLGLGGIDESNFGAVVSASAGFAAIRFLNNPENLNRLSELCLANRHERH